MTRILIVDDSATMRRILKNSLRAMGFEAIEEAESGPVALEKLAGGGIECVISDWAMPEMSGLDLLRHIRARREHARVPVLMIAGAGHEEEILKSAHAGVSGYVVKPFDPATLAARLQQVLAEPSMRG